ncbi:MAG: ATPase, partial [Paracoccaceae bacterium]|nr:ATPase [Paracoccaceae bacterium]
ADSPLELKKLQETGWDPIVKWAENTFKVRINCGTGIVYIPQNEQLFSEIQFKISDLNIFELTAFYDMVSITGSLILGLAIINGRLSAEEAYQLSRVDELWQLEQWGEDEEAQTASNLKNAAILHSEEFFSLSGRTKSTIF